MYSDVVQRTLVYLKQLILKQGFLFSFFFCSLHETAAKTFCFLTLACQRFVLTGDSIFALSLPAWIFKSWEKLLTCRAWLYGKENFILLSRCPENCLFMQFLPNSKSCVSYACHSQPSLSGVAGHLACFLALTFMLYHCSPSYLR